MNSKIKTSGRSCATLAALVGLSAMACAAPIAYEGFAYAPGTPLPAMGGCCGWSAPWIGSGAMVAAAPTLAYPLALPSTGNALHNTQVGEAWRTLPPGLATNFGNDLWISWMEMTGAAAGGAFVSLDPVGAGFGTLQINKDAGGLITASVGGPIVNVGLSKGPGSVDFLVVHLKEFTGSTVVDVYLNPTAPLAVVAPSVTLFTATPYSLGRYYYRSDAGQWLDEIRIGTMPGDVAAGAACYANCDGSTTPPILTANDFNCFLNKYAAGDPYANCDGSTTPPILNANDFSCFLNAFAAGCP